MPGEWSCLKSTSGRHQETIRIARRGYPTARPAALFPPCHSTQSGVASAVRCSAPRGTSRIGASSTGSRWSRSWPGSGWAPTGCPPRPTARRRRSRPWASTATWPWRSPLSWRRRCCSSRRPTGASSRSSPAGAAGTWSRRKLLGPAAGVVSGSALLVDYVLTITISLAAAGDALFSFLPAEWHGARLPVEVGADRWRSRP